ncbi:MAG TPA: glycoside hydrolase family 3 N-terminal domain-containing protein [Nitrospirota bacterium]|nr:glycoside hydrolase family 3 N-terminal domain-containing protein [Nitrospirota bacterium]
MTTRSLARDVAQMVMPRINGDQLGDPRYLIQLREIIKAGIGGFILFGGTLQRTPRMLETLQALTDVPLLIASDVERGLGQQLAGGTRFPNQRAVASAVDRRSKRDVALLNRMLDAVRTETRAAGIHAVFSPVADVNNNPGNPIICTRAFGEEPEIVEWFSSRYIKRLQKPAGKGRLDLLACAKHFPGHGDTDQDSHSVLPVIRADRRRLNRIELPPFREAVQDGVAMVMVAHLLVPALDPDQPTTFSKKTVTALLREGMNFDGLIVSDALDMGALAGIHSQEEIAVRAVEAGMDILLHPHDAMATIKAVVAAVEQGRIPHDRITESVQRIMSAKNRLGLLDSMPAQEVEIDYLKNRRTARDLSRKAVTIIAGNRKQLPVSARSGIACFILDDDNNTESGNAFIHAMRDRYKNLSVLVMTSEAEAPESLVFDSIRAAEYCILAIFSTISAYKGRSGIDDRLAARVVRMLRTVRETQALSVLISFDSPYLLDRFRDADISIAAFDRMDEIQESVAELISGR